jgi:hypothetical protein
MANVMEYQKPFIWQNLRIYTFYTYSKYIM